jgi:CelD/BcsL family acetyltransferase involved in cellulose biosynthesis
MPVMTAGLSVQSVTFESAPPADQWNALLAASGSDVLFLTRQYQEAWWRAFGAEAGCCCCTLHILTLTEGDNLVGLAPFYLARVTPADALEEAARRPATTRVQARARRQTGDPEPPESPALPVPTEGERVVRLVGGVAVTDYLDIIAPPEQAEAAWRAVLAYWADRRGEWDVLDLHSLPPGSPARSLAPRLAAEYGWVCGTEIEETCPVVQLPADWEAYQAALDKKARHELRRKLRRAEAAPTPPTWRLVKDPAALPAAMDEFIALHRRSDAAKAVFMDPRMEAFFHSLIPALAGTGWLELALLDVGDRPAAAYLSFEYGGRIYLYNSGYDPEFSDLSAGFVLLARRLAAAVEAGVPCFDFLRGDERYKYELGGADHFLHRVLLRPGGAA